MPNKSLKFASVDQQLVDIRRDEVKKILYDQDLYRPILSKLRVDTKLLTVHPFLFFIKHRKLIIETREERSIGHDAVKELRDSLRSYFDNDKKVLPTPFLKFTGEYKQDILVQGLI